MRDALLKTFAYFDLFDFPLTTIEAWKYAQTSRPVTLAMVQAALGELIEAGRIEAVGSYWVLTDRGAIAGVRQGRAAIADRKYARVRRALSYLRRIPSIRMIAVCNTLALNHARDASDIDLFIVTRPGAMWLSRLLAVTPFAFLGLRPVPGNERDTFCFSFFASESALDFSPLRIGARDPYLLYWLATLVPVYDPDGLVEALWDANPWLREQLPNAWPTPPSSRRGFTTGRRQTIDMPMESPAGFFETSARALQMIKLSPTLRSIMNVDHRVVVTDEVLKFHPIDRRNEISAAYEARVHEVCGSS